MVIKSTAWDFVSLVTYQIPSCEFYLCYWKTRILDLIDSAWQAKAMNGNGILAESLIFLALPKFC